MCCPSERSGFVLISPLDPAILSSVLDVVDCSPLPSVRVLVAEILRLSE